MKKADEIVQKFELELALRFLNTPYIEKRVHGLNILISKVNLVNRSSFDCTWKRKMFINMEDLWLTSEIFLNWLLDNDIFGLFFGEKLHSELVVKYYAVLSFLYSKDKLNEKHFELIWDCAINKHDAYRVNILKVLSTLSLKMKPSHSKFLFEKLKQLENSEYCKFTLQLLKHLNKNSCKGPMTDKAAQEAGFGKTQRRDEFNMGDILNIQAIDLTGIGKKREKKTRSFSLGGEEKETSKPSKGRHNSPDATGRRLGEVYPSINIGSLDKFPSETLVKKNKRNRSIDKVKNIFDIEVSKEESKVHTRKQNEHQSTDEEDKEKEEGVVTTQDDFALIKERLEKGLTKTKVKQEDKKKLNDWEVEELKKQMENLPENEKEIKEEMKEDTIEHIWKLCQESMVLQGVNISVHRGAIDTFSYALTYNSDEMKWKYISKIVEKLQQNESVIAMINILKKFIQTFPEGDIEKIKNPEPGQVINEIYFPKTRIELIGRLDRDFSLMNELMSLNIEFKRTTLDLLYDHLGRNVDREQSLETQSSLSSQAESEGEDTEEEEDVQTDAGSHQSNDSKNINEDNGEGEENDTELKTEIKPQALSEDDGFIVPRKRTDKPSKIRRHSNNGDEEEKENTRGANQPLSITDMSMTDEDNKEKEYDRRIISKRSNSVSHRDPRHNEAIPESPLVHNYRESDFIMNVETHPIYEMKYFSEIEERLGFIKYLIKNSDELIKPVHIKILWECHIDSSFHQKERAIFFDWCSSIIRIQSDYQNTRRESMTIFDDDTIELIFFESLLCLDFTTIPEEAYDCFEEYFCYINAQFGQLIKGTYIGSYEVFDTKLIGIQALWEIVLQAKDQKVHKKSSKFLLTLYRKLSPDLLENLNAIKEDFLKTCMTHIREGVKYLTHGNTSEEKDNAKNRVARSLDQICKFIHEFEGLRDKSKKSGSAAPEISVLFTNQMGQGYSPSKGEIMVPKTIKIEDLKKKLCEVIQPNPHDYELLLIYKGKDIGANDVKTLNDFGYAEGGKIMVSKNSGYDYIDDDIPTLNIPMYTEKELEDNANQLAAFVPDLDIEVLKLALKKNDNSIEEALLLVTGDGVEGLQAEVAEQEEQNAFIPIISKEEEKNEEEKQDEEMKEDEEQESKLNLIISNKSEYFDLLFDLLNLGVNDINYQAWNLLTQIPVNKKLYHNIKNLSINKREDWNALIDSQNMYKCLYSLQIINSLICSPDSESIEENELQERYEWRLRFINLGGFEHITNILVTQGHIEESLKQQRRTRNNRKKNKSDEQGNVNFSIHKTGLYMVNIIRIFTQAALLAKSEDDNLLYTIISQSATSPFIKKTKSIGNQGQSSNSAVPLIDNSDGSKDNSAYGTPNFASPKSSNNQSHFFEPTVTFNEDLDLVTKVTRNSNRKENKGNNTICTQVDDFQKLIDQVTGEISSNIMEIIDQEKLLVKLLSIIYYAIRVTDYNDKNISLLIDSCFDLILPCVVNSPDNLIPVMYASNNFENFIVSTLRFKGEESVRKTVSNTFKSICSNYNKNTQYSKEQFKKTPKKKASEGESEGTEEVSSAPYEDPKFYFLKVLLKNLPSTNSKSEKCEEMFNLLNTLIKMTSTLFSFTNPYDPQPESEEIEPKRIFSANSVFDTCIKEIENRPTLEERHSDYEDKVLGGYLGLANSVLQITPQLRKYAGDEEKGYGLTRKLFNFLFEMPNIDDKDANLPKFKHRSTRKKALNLILNLCQGYEESGGKHQINENYYTLFKELYLYHNDMNEIEKNATVNFDEFDYDIGVRNNTGFAGLKNFGATCYQNSVLQQLFMIPDLRFGILASEINIEEKTLSTLFQMQLIFANLQETEKKYHTPRDFCLTFNIDGAPVDVSRQQDAQEFFNIILDNIEGHLKGTQNEKLLKEVIGGEICNEVKSLEDQYDYISQTMEPFFSVQLDIKNRKNIQEALDYYIKPDVLEGDNKYYCEDHDTKIKAHKRSFLNSTSNTLIINLKRFEFDFNTFRKYKVNDYCEFPLDLNIKPWTKEGIQEREGKQEESEENEELIKEESQEEEKYQYEAVGVVVHSGGAEGGHYYSYIKDRERNKWFEFNDTTVKPFDIKDLPEETFGGDGNRGNMMENNDNFGGLYSRSRNAYLIIYQRKNPAPYETVQLSNASNDYVNGIPQSVYKHILDENMLFMKRMYFFDTEYLNFIREFLSLNHFDRKIYSDSSQLTKKMIKQKEMAQVLGITESNLNVEMAIEDIDMFDEIPDKVEVKDEEKFDPDKDLGSKDVGGAEDRVRADGMILAKTDHLSQETIEKAKAISASLSIVEDNKDFLEDLVRKIKENPDLFIIKFSTLFALKIKEQIKDSFQFISLLQNLSSMFDMQADGCMWFLKYLTYNKRMIIEHLLKNKSDEERENFRALLINAIGLACKNEEKEFFKPGTDDYNTEIIAEYDQEKDKFYAKQVPKSVVIRFMQVFFEEMLDDTRAHYQQFEDYFSVLKYFAELGIMETKYLIKAKGIHRMMDFVMNNCAPYNVKGRRHMGTAISEPKFKIPTQILSLLMRSCVTRGIKETESYSSNYAGPKENLHIDIPYEEIRMIMTRECFTIGLLGTNFEDFMAEALTHLCWEDKSNSKFFIHELAFSMKIHQSNMGTLMKRKNLMKAILLIEDGLQDDRIQTIYEIRDEDQEQTIEGLIHDNRYSLIKLSKEARKDYPLFTMEMINLIRELRNVPKLVLYLSKHQEKLTWIREFLTESIEVIPRTYPIIRAGSKHEARHYLDMIDSCITNLSVIFPEWKDWFRMQREEKQPPEDHKEEGAQENKQEGGSEPTKPVDEDFVNIDIAGADDDFKNVASAGVPEAACEKKDQEEGVTTKVAPQPDGAENGHESGAVGPVIQK